MSSSSVVLVSVRRTVSLKLLIADDPNANVLVGITGIIGIVVIGSTDAAYRGGGGGGGDTDAGGVGGGDGIGVDGKESSFPIACNSCS